MLRLGAAGAAGPHPLFCGQFAGAARHPTRRRQLAPALPIHLRRARPSRSRRPRLRESIRSCSPAPRPRWTGTGSRRATAIGIADFSRPSSEPRFHLVDLQNGTVESHLVCHGRGSDPAPFGLSRAVQQRFRKLCDVERHLRHRRLLPGQIRPVAAGARARLDQQQCRAARDRHPQRLVRRAGDDPGRTACSAARKAASRCRKTSQYEVMRRLAGGRMIYADKLA